MFLRNIMSHFFVVKHIPKMLLLLHNNNACCSLFGQIALAHAMVGIGFVTITQNYFITSCLYEPVWKLKKLI